MASLSGVALATMIGAGGITKAVGERRSATAAEREADYQAGVLGINADLAEQAAADAIARGTQKQNQARAGTRQLRGAQRATLAAQGIDVNTGSAADIALDTEQIGELELATIANNAQREALGFKIEAANYRSQAALTRYAGRNTAAGLRNESISTLLTTGAQLGDLAYRSGWGQKSKGGKT